MSRSSPSIVPSLKYPLLYYSLIHNQKLNPIHLHDLQPPKTSKLNQNIVGHKHPHCTLSLAGGNIPRVNRITTDQSET